jgi:hypothetical protein
MIEVRSSPEIIYDLPIDNIFIKESFLDKNICKELILENEANIELGKPKNWSGVWSKCYLNLDHSIHSILNNVWEEAELYFNTKLLFVEQYHLKKYEIKNFYGTHVDNFGSIAKKIDRKLSLVVQLSDENEYSAGNLSIKGNAVTKKIGSIIIFPSSYQHEVKQIANGTRWSLISWAWGPAF